MGDVDAFGSGYDELERPGDLPIAQLATRQHGVVATRQLHALGYTTSAITRRVQAGRLHPLHRGVYLVGYLRISRKGRWMAAVLACGSDAVLSHRSGIVLWELRPGHGGAVDVLVPGRTRHSRPGICVHNVRTLDPEDRALVDGIPVTTVHRTLLDFAEVAHPQQLRLAIEASERRELFDLNALNALIARSPGRKGVKALRAILREMHGEVPWTRSELERAFLALLREHGLPEPLVNVLVEGYLVDFYWPRYGLIAELDGYEFHRSKKVFHSDRRRDTKLLIAGHPVIRITEWRVRYEPLQLIADVRQLLARLERA